MFGRKLRTKPPELREFAKLDEEIRDQDKENKIKMKEYAGRKRSATESNLTKGDKVFLRQQRANKWTASFETQPYEVINKHGSSVLIESPEGVRYKRNTSHVKQYQERETDEHEAVEPPTTEETSSEEANSSDDLKGMQGNESGKKPAKRLPEKLQRPVCARRTPRRFDDYTFCCSLSENILSLMPSSNSLTQKYIHFFQSTLISEDNKPFVSKGIQKCKQRTINTILLYIRDNKTSIRQDISLA